MRNALMRHVAAKAGSDILERSRHAIFIGWSLVLAATGTVTALLGPALDVPAASLFGGLMLAASLGGIVLSRFAHVGTAQTIQTTAMAAVLFFAGELPGTSQALVAVLAFMLVLEASLMGRKELSIAAGVLAAGVVMANAFLPDTGLVLLDQTSMIDSWVLVGSVLYGAALLGRLQAIQTLQANLGQTGRRRARFLAAVMQEGILELDSQGTLISAAGTVGELFQRPSHVLLDEGIRDLVHVADRPIFLATLAEAQASREAVTIEVRMRAGGWGGVAPHHFWAEMRIHPIPHSGSSILGDEGADVVVLIHDVTARRDAEEGRKASLERAEEASAAKSRFLATMSHELRTPLNAIIGFADILDQGVFGKLDNPQQREYVTLIRDSGIHLLQVVNDILDLSKIEAGHFSVVAEPFNPLPVLARTVEMVRPQVTEKKQVLNLHLDDALEEVVADQRAIKQIVLNLLSNASKFTEEGGRVSLRVCRDGADMLISVSDTGIGIPKDHLKSIGQPFYQVDSAYGRQHQGTGLGLSVVRGLIELHDGRFELTSVEGEGTTVTIRIPLAGPAPKVEEERGSLHSLPAPRPQGADTKGTEKKARVA